MVTDGAGRGCPGLAAADAGSRGRPCHPLARAAAGLPQPREIQVTFTSAIQVSSSERVSP